MKKLLSLFTISLILAGSSLPLEKVTAGAHYYASPLGTGDTCSWDAPCSFQSAVDKAQAGDHIYAHSGTYLAASPSDPQVLNIKGEIWLYGGCNWTTASDVSCSPSTTPSILDGQNMRRVITIADENSEVRLYGLTIRNGNADGINPILCPLKGGGNALGCGGGIFASVIQSLTLGNIIFEDNVASSDTTGTGTSLGGALYAFDLQELYIYNSRFTNNAAGLTGIGMGGAIHIEGDSILTTGEISGSIFAANDVPDSTYSKGGAILIYHSGYMEIYRNSFVENNNHKHKIDGAAIYFLEMTSGTFNFSENLISANYGQTILHSYTTPSRATYNTIERNIFKDNTATSMIHLEGRDNHIIRNNFVTYNSLLNVSRADNSNIFLKGINPDHILVYVYHNSLAGGVDAISLDGFVTTYIKKNIIANTQNGINTIGSGVSASVDSNLFFENDSDGATGINPFFGDPKFINLATGDLHVLKGSAAIDRLAIGEGPNDDIDTINIRPIGSGPTPYDIGADEWDLVNEVHLPLIFR